MNEMKFEIRTPWLVLCLAAACADTQGLPSVGGDGTGGPSGGTETGNPPLIDAQRIALVVSADDLRVTGTAGAVSPAGIAVEVVALSTGAVFSGTAAPDGSFEITVEGPLAETYEVRAVGTSARSDVAYVLRGGASVTAGENGSLSCDAWQSLASMQINGAAGVADTRCVSDADCEEVPLGTACSDACSPAYVSHAGAQQLQEARAAIEGGLCQSFAGDGCTVIALPCVPPQQGTLSCVRAACTLVTDQI